MSQTPQLVMHSLSRHHNAVGRT